MTKLTSLLAMLMLFVGSLGGCTRVEKMVDSLTDEELADYVYKGAKFTGKAGIKAALEKYPDHAEDIKADALLAARLINNNVLPVFNGATTEDVLRGAVDTALAELADKLSPATVEVIRLAMVVVVTEVDLPDNRAEKLSVRAKMAVSAFFKGLADAVAEVFPPEPVPAPEPVVEPAPVPAPEPVVEPMGKAFGFAKPKAKSLWPTIKTNLTWPTNCKCDPCVCNPCVCAH